MACTFFNTILAQGIENPALSSEIRNLSGTDFLGKLLPNLITIFLIAAVIVALFVLIAGGIRWITAGGDKEGAAKAQKTITSAVIGLSLVFCLYAILKLIGYFFGINLIEIDIGPLILGE